MGIKRVRPAIELETPYGHALCHFLIDNGEETDLQWVCFGEDGQIWQWSTQEVRAVKNITYHRPNPEKPQRRDNDARRKSKARRKRTARSVRPL